MLIPRWANALTIWAALGLPWLANCLVPVATADNVALILLAAWI